MIAPTAECCVIVAVKRFRDAKSRLAPICSSQQRMTWSLAMFGCVVLSIRQAESRVRLFVVTDDPDASQIAEDNGGTIVADPGAGLSEAFNCGLAQARNGGALWCLLLPADLPLIRASSIDRILRLARHSDSAVICPDRAHHGTNAIVMRADRAFDLSFGNASFARHLGAACRKGPVIVATDPCLSCDLDTADDLEFVLT